MSRIKKVINKICKGIVGFFGRHLPILIILNLTLLVNLLSWIAPWISNMTGLTNWCDVYAKYANPVIVAVFARIMNVFKFSVGEIMIVSGIVLALAVPFISAAAVFLRKKKRYMKFYKRYMVFISYVLVILAAVMTLNMGIYYHTAPLDGNYNAEYRQYTVDELEKLRNHVVNMCNTYSDFVNRDEDGRIVYEGDIMALSKKAIKNIGSIYPRLNGYYPDVKPMMFSSLMTQGYMAGYYFPYSMEANVNSRMYVTNYPYTYCHELSHLHGYMPEDEANFIAFLACAGSEDVFIRYSGYLGVINYINRAYLESINYDLDRYMSQEQLKDIVYEDNTFVLKEVFDEIEEASPVTTEQMDKLSTSFTNATLNANGVSDGMASYGRVVDLLLQYYDGYLY